MERRPGCSLLALLLLAALCAGLVRYVRNNSEFIHKLTAEVELLETAKGQIDQSLKRFDLELQQMMKQKDDAKQEVENLQGGIKQMRVDEESMAKKVEVCQQSVVTLNKDIAAVEQDRRDSEANFAALKSKLSDTTKDLEENLHSFSPVCAFVRKGSDTRGQCPQTAIQQL